MHLLTCMYKFWCEHVFSSLENMSRCGIAGSSINSMFNFLRNHQTVFHSSCTVFFFYSYHNVWVFQFLYILARVHNRLLTGSYSPVCSLHGRQSGLLSFFLFCPVLSKILEEEERKRNFDQLPPTARVCAWPGINLPPFGVRGDAPTSWATTVRARVVILKFKAKHGTDM